MLPGLPIIERYIGTLNLVIGQSAFLNLPRDFFYAGLRFRFSASVAISAGTTNGTVADENPQRFLNRVLVHATGGGRGVQLKNMRGEHMLRTPQLLAGQEPNIVPLTSGAVATTPVSCVLDSYFALISAYADAPTSRATVLNPRLFGALQLEVLAGSALDFVNGGDRTIAINAAVVDVYALQVVGYQPTTAPLLYIEQLLFRASTAALATQQAFQTAIPIGRLYRYLGFRTTNEAANVRQPVDDTFGAFMLKAGPTIIKQYRAFNEYAMSNRMQNQVITATNPAGLNPLGSQSNPVVGYYMFDFLNGGEIGALLDTRRFPQRGITIDPLPDIVTASARQIDVYAGWIQQA